MNNTMAKVLTWFQYNKLNLNPSKIRFMIFNSKDIPDNNHMKQMVWILRECGKVDGKKLSNQWVSKQMINLYLGRTHTLHSQKISCANCSLNRARTRLPTPGKKILFSGLIHSPIEYRASLWGFATKTDLINWSNNKKKAKNIYFGIQRFN